MTITRKRLIEAICQENSNALQAILNVKKAAERALAADVECSLNAFSCLAESQKEQGKGRVLVGGDGGNCLLAHAWMKPFHRIHVSSAQFKHFSAKDVDSYGPWTDHNCKDVVYWFDHFSNPKEAAQVVLDLLDGKVQEHKH